MRFRAFFLALLFIAPAWAGDEACVICSAQESRLHLESCSYTEAYGGTTYHFCQKTCLESFQGDPAGWVAKFDALRTAEPVAKVLPSFKFPLKPAGTLSSEDLRGKVLLLNLWATWCGPCKEEMPDLVRLQDEYGERDLVVLAISFDKTEEAHRKGVKALELNFPSFFAEDEEVAKFLDELGEVSAIPVTFIVDGQGNIAARIDGKGDYERFRQAIEPLLPKAEAPKQEASHGSVAPS